jgi:predicted O-methyltransferase YrrM
MKESGGMINPRTYKKLYDEIYKLPDKDIVEVGGATGGASIFIAKAMKSSGKKSNLLVIEKCAGGSRTELGDYNKNKKLILDNFKRFNIREKITPFLEELTFEKGPLVKNFIKTDQISAIIHDADGRIDRDFSLFWELLMPEGLIVIDDYANIPVYKEISERYPAGGTKYLITYHLLNQFIEWGLFEEVFRIGKTIFGKKPKNASFDKFSLARCNEILEKIENQRIQHLKKHNRETIL